MSVALHIRDVPEDVRDQLAEQARAKGQSLQAYLLKLVTEDAARQRNVTLMSRIEGRTGGSNLDADQAAALAEALPGGTAAGAQ